MQAEQQRNIGRITSQLMPHESFAPTSATPAQHDTPRRTVAPEPLLIDANATLAIVVATAACLALVVVAHASGGLLRFLEGEKGLIEIVSALAYPVGVWYAIKLVRLSHGLPRAHWILWAVLCVLFFGEETSWLQSWLGYATPAKVKAANLQSEFNFHNLKALTIEGDLINGAGFALSWRSLLDAQRLFYLGFATYFLFIPALRAIGAVDRLARRCGVPRYSARLLAMVWVPVAVSVIFTYTYRAAWLQKDLIGETREMFFALTIAVCIAAAYHRAACALSSSRSARCG